MYKFSDNRERWDASIIRAAEIMAKSYGWRIIGAIEKPLTVEKLTPLLLRHFGQKRGRLSEDIAKVTLDEIVMGMPIRQFFPHFQPKVDVRTGMLVGVEALMRWAHPERGLIPPCAFVPVMEASGLIGETTFELIEAALGRFSTFGLEDRRRYCQARPWTKPIS